MNRQQTQEIIALYCRFSQDDGKKESDSNSIQNQKEYLMDYAKKHHFPNPQFYVDDGYTGTNFDRPDFKRMNEDLQKGTGQDGHCQRPVPFRQRAYRSRQVSGNDLSRKRYSFYCYYGQCGHLQ